MKKSISKKCSIGIISTILVASFACLITLVVKQNKTNDKIDEALNELKINEGMYDTKSIVLTNTNKTKAEDIAKRLNAKLRINESGTYATLTLPENVDVKSIYENKENIDLLDDFSLNMYAKTSEIEEVTKEHLPSRPSYNSTINDDSYNKQTYLDYLNMKDTWNSYMGDNVTVAIIDTGIDTDHSEFVGKISEYSYNATEDKIIKDYKDSNGNYDYSLIEDEVGHGTAVAGVIASSFNGTGIVGIAPNVNLLIIKAECAPNGQFYRSSDLVFGLYYAIERNADVVNMSFGGGSNVYKDAAKLAVDNDIICVAAAGNEATSSLTYPAADENVIGVGALANGSYELASYSNFGENTDLVAPGTVYTTSLNNSYKIMDGTSFASPIVAASIALLRQQNYKMEFKDVCELLYASSYDLGSKGKDYYYGYGALDLSALLLEERGIVTFDTLTDEIDDIKKVFIRNHTLQDIPEVERNYAVFDGWYYDVNLIDELNYYNDIFSSDLTLYALWGNEDDVVPYTYITLPDNTIEIRSYTGHRRYITIPNKIENKDVTSIGDFAFSGNRRIREVNLPNKLNNIGSYAFSDCSNLVSITIPNGVKELGSYAFSNDSRLSEIIISDNSSLTKIGDFAFTNCNLFIFEVPKNVTYLNGSAFYGCRMLTSYNVKKGNQSFISDSDILYNNTRSTLVAYPANKNDKEFKILDKTSIIGPYAFACSKIENINLNKVSSISNAAFINSSLTNLNILDSVKEIGELSFAYCYDLKELIIGHGLNNIPSGAFLYNTSLESIVIPNNIQYILGGEFGAFEKCFALKDVTFEDNSKLVLIDKSAFASCNLQNISIPKNVVEIRDGAFSLNYNLNLVTFDKDSVLKSIGEKTFIYSYSLSNISLPKTLINIGSFAFAETNLNEVTIPSSLTSFGEGAFASCSNLENIYVEANNKNYVSIDGVVYSKNKEILIEFPAGKKIYSYTINNSTKKIGRYAFYGSNNLNYIHLSENLEEIDEYAFAYVSNLSFINITDNVTLIGRYAFSNDYNLSSINFTTNSKLPRISFASFSNCGINSFTIPSNVSTISQYVFSGCDNLTQINFARNSKVDTIPSFMFDGCKSLNSIIFEEGSNLKTIQAHGFANLNSLTTIDLSNTKVNSIGNYAFANCSNLTNITLNNNLTSIGRYAFYKCNNLLSIDIPSSVNYIGRYAFYSNGNIDVYFKGEVLPATLQENWDNGIKGYYVGIKDIITENDFQYAKLSNNNIALIKYTGSETILDLTTINLNGTISQIGGYAFYNSPVKKIILPNTINSIERYAFAYSKIEEINIPSSVTFIGNNAFIKSNISKITFESNSNLERIEQYAFAFTSNLKVITLPKSLVSVGSYMFYESGLESINFEEGILLTNISKHMFSSSKITDIVIPNSVNYIDDSAFRDCTSLTNVVLSDADNLQIHANAFYNTSLTTINIPNNVTYIGEYSLVGLRNLKAYNVSNDNLYYKDIDGVLFSKDGKKLIAYPANKEGSYIINKDVETIGFGAFENSSLSNVTFEDNINLLTIGYRAFYDSKKLKEITIPNSVVSIDYYAFANCESLESVLFEKENKLTGIYEGAFYNCSKLSNIIIPDSIIEISDFAFYGCKSLTKLPISENNNLRGIYQYAFAYTGITSLVVPDSVIDIDNYAFAGSKLNKVYISNVKQKEFVIGLGAFYDCNELKEITLPFIGKSFEDDEISWLGYIFGAGNYEANNTYVPESLKKVTINEGISKIGVGGFNKCENLEIINVPHSVVYVSNYAFNETTARYELTNEIAFDEAESFTCFGKGISGELKIKNGITRLPCLNSTKDLIYVSIPNSVTTIDSSAFNGCSGLTNIEIPNSVTSIGDFAFFDCSSLRHVEIPNSVITIGDSAFYNCSSLRSVEIPNSVTNIGDSAFRYCESINEIILSNSLISIGEYAFTNCKIEELTIPNSVIEIGDWAFEYCGNLKKVKIGENLSSLAPNSFFGCEILYVENSSDLELSFDSSDYRFLVVNARIITDKNGIKYFKQENENTLVFETIDGFMFKQENNNYTLISYNGSKNEVTLPLNINNSKYNISYFVNGAAKIINVPDSFVEIGEYAFYKSSVSKFTLPNSVISIGKYAFAECSELKEINIPNKLELIDDYAFQRCGKISTIKLNDGITYIGNNSFFGCSSLNEINLSNTIISIGESAFASSGLKEINIPNSVTKIGYGAFQRCSNLQNVTLGNGIIEICGSLFEYCKNLTNIIIPENIETISGSAFSYCNNLKEIILPNSLKTIGGYAFYNCINLETINIPQEVQYISLLAFNNCDKLIINLNENNKYFKQIDGIIYNTDETSIVYISPSVETLIVKKTVSGYRNFSNNTKIKKVIFENGITEIYNGEFEKCSNLVSVEISNSITSIGDLAFHGCNNLIDVSIPDSVTTIGEAAFAGCSSLRNIKLPSYLTKISRFMFSGCISLESFEFSSIVTSIEANAFRYCNSLKKIVIPNNVTTIGAYAFAECKNLEEAYLPDDIVNMVGGEFYGCKNLRIVLLPSKLNNIGKQMFYNCENLEDIIIPESVTSIEDLAFYGCKSLTSLNLHDGIEKIGKGAFSNCSSLKALALSSGLTEISSELFENCSNLLYLNIPEQVEAIGDRAFKNCINLKRVILPSQIKKICNLTFSGCNSLIDIIIPSSVEIIEDYAFNDCKSLSVIYNNSSLSFEFNSYTNGSIAYYAKIIYEKDNLKRTLDNNDIEIIDTSDDFRFIKENNEYKLISYIGNDKTINLPRKINGYDYTINYFTGGTNVIIPEGIKKIDYYAFAYNKSLESIIFPSTLLYIGDYAFMGCSKLNSIILPSDLIYLGDYAFADCQNLCEIIIESKDLHILQNVFSGTEFYNNNSNWVNGYLYINDYLIKVSKMKESVIISNPIKSIALDAFRECYSLKRIYINSENIKINDWSSFGTGMLSSAYVPNLETLSIASSIGNNTMSYLLFGNDIPITLKNVILLKSFEIMNENQFIDLTGINIFVEDSKEDTALWDVYYKGWNNGNKVYYKGEWINANFYDMNNTLISNEYYTINQIIRRPYVNDVIKDNKKLVFVGWDINDDGIVDSIPATSTKNITAKAIMKEVDNIITVRYFDYDNKELYSQTYNYGDEIVLPTNNPTKKGYTFMGWDGYVENMTVTKDINLYSMWSHLNNGHEYVLTTISPTCETEGYDKYVCSICDHEYHTNIKSKLGHSYNDWIIDTNAICEEDGLRHHICSRCNYNEEEIIPALGHNYQVINEIPSTCTSEGKIEYQCLTCQNKTTETLSMTSHNYVKKKVNKTWLQWLIERLLNIFFGYEGDEGFYYQCSECNHIQTIEERNSGSSALSTCEHELKDFETILDATCNNDGILGRYCIKCNKLIEAKTINKLDHNYSIVEVINPTCTEKGYTKHTCSLCNDSYNDTFTKIIDHTYGEWLEEVDATCESEGIRGHYECSSCHKYFDFNKGGLNDLVINKLGHDLIHHERLEATCTSIGHEAYDECSRCDYTTYKEIAKKPHDYKVEWSHDENSHYHECKNCDAKIDVTNHTSNWITDKDSTCTETGLKHEECSICHYIRNENTIVELKEHAYGTWIEEISATCESNGILGHYKCSNCDKYFDSNKKELTILTITKLGHDLIHHERLEATCTSVGHEAYDECSRCDYTTYKEIGKLPHDYKEEWSYDENDHYHECKNCDAKDNIINHEFIWITDKDSTCTETGLKHEECEVCGYIRNENTIVELKEHSYGTWIEEVPATCENNGILGHYKCSNCDKYFDFNKKELTILTITKLGHDLTLHAKLDPTCENDGHNAYYTCSRCDYTTYKVIDKLGHNLQHHEKLEPTCIEDGHEEYDTCTRCNYTTYKTIDKLGHDLVHHERLDATCISIGHEAYDECSRCDYTTYKEIAKLPHDYKTEWSYDENGHYHECKNCSHKEDESVHSYLWIVDVEPTEDATGTKHEECSVCHSKRNENTIIPTLSHTHNMEHVSRKEATCEVDGNIEYYHCSKCGKNYTDEYGNNEIVDITIKASHKYGLWVEEISATCENNGVKGHYECSICHKYFDTNKNEINNLVINKLGHNLIHHKKLEPTCIEDGYEAYDTCSRCDYTTYKTINKLGHNLIHHERLEATCTSIGHEAYDECNRCDYTTYKAIEMLPHDYKEGWSYDENGHYHECKNCNHREDESVHSYTWIIDVESTEDATGTKHEECSVCHSKRNENTLIEKLDHKHQMEHVSRKEATCEEDGNIEYYHCIKCNKNYVDLNGNDVITKVNINATGHSYGTWIEEVSATCENDGVKGHYECSSCHKYFDNNKNEINNVVINKLGHNLQHHDKLEPTCIEDGYEAYDTCTRCNYTTYKTINKLEHDLTHCEKLEATCTSIGHEAYDECSRCDYTTYKEIAKLPHDYKVEWSYDENGHYHECKNCDAKTNVTNHEFTWIIDKDSTCKEEGIKHEECEVCHYTRNENTVIELKEHTIVVDKAVEATCISTGLTEGKHCSVCNEVLVAQEETAKKEHTFGEWHVVKEATTTEEGKEERTCSSCNTTESRSIAKITKNGCKGNVATSIITLITCLGLLLHFRKKYY